MLKRARTGLVHELLVPTPGRLERTLHLVAVTSLVVVVSMTYRIPEPGLSAYMVYFVSKEDSGRTILTSIVFIIAILIVISAVFVLLPYTLDQPSLRILFIAGVSFTLFFLGSASKLAPLAGTLGLVLASGLNAEQNLPSGEIATRALLYILLAVWMPIGIQIAFNICGGRRPDRLLRHDLQVRLLSAAAVLRHPGAADASVLEAAAAAGNGELLTLLKMSGLFHFLPKEALPRFKALIDASYGVVLAVRNRRDDLSAQDAAAFAARLEAIARGIGAFPWRREDLMAAAQADDSFRALLATMETALSRQPLPPGKAAPGKEKSGFFKPGTFTDPIHERFAAKATAAALTCYLAFNLVDWPKISTCLVTVFIVSLSTNGESTQKMLLRITGCVIGALLGLGAIVFVLPHVTEVAGLLILIACITVPAGWIAFGSPRVSYIGFQMAFAAYLCVLQGSSPAFDLAVARDRFVGILFGNFVVYLYFANIYPASLLPGLTQRLLAILARCRDVLHSARENQPILTLVAAVAELQGLVAPMDAAVIAYGFEKRTSRFARLHVLACHLILRTLHALVSEIAALSTLPAGEQRAEACTQLEARLFSLADAIKARTSIDTAPHRGPGAAGTGSSVATEIHGTLDRLAVTIARYRRIVRREGGLHA